MTKRRPLALGIRASSLLRHWVFRHLSSGVGVFCHSNRSCLIVRTSLSSWPRKPAAVTTDRPEWNLELPRYQRIILVATGLLLLTQLAVAGCLQPAPEGYGTHRQLGLPPCSFQTWFGFRCPTCGMTTSWAYLVRGRLMGSLSANTGGTLLGVLAIVMAPWAIVSGWRGEWMWRPLDDVTAVSIGASVLLVTMADWIVRVWI